MKLAARQNGAALLVALSFLVVITLISVAAMRSSTTELRLASNHEASVAALEVAQSAIDAALNDPDFFIFTGVTGTENSTTGGDFTISGVTEFSHAAVTITEGATKNPPRGLGLSADKFQGTEFYMSSTYDNLDAKRGQAQVEQGIVLIVPKS
jgi:type IV pilus assembly protein PilX